MNLHVRSTSDALALLRLLGYEAAPKPYDARDVGLESEGLRIFSDRSRTQGYGVLLPRSTWRQRRCAHLRAG